MSLSECSSAEGIDSSAIVALLAEIIPAHQIKTFCIGFDERSFDESEAMPGK